MRKLTLKADAFPGKDIDGLNKMIRGGHSRLVSCNSVPKDMYELIYRAYQTSSVPEFNNMFEFYLNLHKRPVEPGESARVGDITALLQSGETEYRSLHGRGVWTALLKSHKLKQAGGFYGGDDNKTVVCYRCRKEGHTSRDCMERFPFGKEGSTDTGKEVANTLSPARTKPKEGESHTNRFFMINGKEVRKNWCTKCNLWQTSHLAADHITKAEKIAKAAAAYLAAANVAAASIAAVPTGVTGGVAATNVPNAASIAAVAAINSLIEN